jgi:hypothetical protein
MWTPLSESVIWIVQDVSFILSLNGEDITGYPADGGDV